jgi:hypothetical protein
VRKFFLASLSSPITEFYRFFLLIFFFNEQGLETKEEGELLA